MHVTNQPVNLISKEPILTKEYNIKSYIWYSLISLLEVKWLTWYTWNKKGVAYLQCSSALEVILSQQKNTFSYNT